MKANSFSANISLTTLSTLQIASDTNSFSLSLSPCVDIVPFNKREKERERERSWLCSG